MTKSVDISNPFEVTERKILAVENIVDRNKYLTILFFSHHYTYLDTCPKYHPYNNIQKRFVFARGGVYFLADKINCVVLCITDLQWPPVGTCSHMLRLYSSYSLDIPCPTFKSL